MITDGLEYGSHLLEDDLIDEDNRAKIRQDVHHLEGDLVKLEQANDDEHKRYHLKSCETCYRDMLSSFGLTVRCVSYPFFGIALTTNH